MVPIIRMTLGVIVLGIVVGGAYGIYELFFKPAGPPPVDASSAPAASAAAGASVLAPSAADGTWEVDTSIGTLADGTSSFVGYRVQEQLASIGGNTAVGRTSDLSGSLTLRGTTVTAVEISAHLASLKSDDDRRDGQLRRQALETDTFGYATFKLTQPIELGSLPSDGATLSKTATGDLTLHGVTRTVSIALKATRHGGVMTVTGSMTISFADYQIQKPTSFAVLSVDDHGTMEFQLHFVHA
jgi:polyisoprenoid-binding protein YceI